MLKDKLKLKALSLIELSISLLIIGIILGSVFKGVQLVEHVKLQSIAKQFQEIRLHFEHYVSHHGEFPGSKQAYASLEDTKQAFEKLYEKGIVRSKSFVKSKLGGLFKLKTLSGKHYIQLVSESDAPILNITQIERLKSFFNFEDGDSSCIMDGDLFSYPLSN